MVKKNEQSPKICSLSIHIDQFVPGAVYGLSCMLRYSAKRVHFEKSCVYVVCLDRASRVFFVAYRVCYGCFAVLFDTFGKTLIHVEILTVLEDLIK